MAGARAAAGTAAARSPGSAARRSHYLKVRDRASYEFALASAAVVLDQGGVEGGAVADERLGHEHPLGAGPRDLDEPERLPRTGQDLVGDLGGRREAAAASLLLVPPPGAALAARGAPGEVARWHGMALASPVGELALGRRLDQAFEPGGILLHAPLDERERALLHRQQPPLRARQAAVRGELVGHRVLRDLADVVEQVLPDGDLGQLLEMKRLSLAPQHLDGGFRERHARPSMRGERTSWCRPPAVSTLKRRDSAVMLEDA